MELNKRQRKVIANIFGILIMAFDVIGIALLVLSVF